MAVGTPRLQRAGRSLIALTLTLSVAGCAAGPATSSTPSTAPAGGAAPTATAGSASTTAASPSVPAPASPTAIASSTAPDDVFTSAVYPYTLTLPSSVVQVVWHPAARAWDGHEPIASDAEFDDRNGLEDGGLFILGTRWTGSLKTFVSTVQENVIRNHGCSDASEVRSIAVGGAPGTAWSHRCADVLVVRVASVHAGWGLAASEQVVPEREQSAADRLADWIGKGLSWRPS